MPLTVKPDCTTVNEFNRRRLVMSWFIDPILGDKIVARARQKLVDMRVPLGDHQAQAAFEQPAALWFWTEDVVAGFFGAAVNGDRMMGVDPGEVEAQAASTDQAAAEQPAAEETPQETWRTRPSLLGPA